MKSNPLTLYLHHPCANPACRNTLHAIDMIERDGMWFCPGCAAEGQSEELDLDLRPAVILLLWLLLAALVLILALAWGTR